MFFAEELRDGTIRVLIVLTIIMLGLSSAHAATTKKIEKLLEHDQPYGISVQAFRGPHDTEVIASFTSGDSDLFPLPENLKKIQIKIKDEADEVSYILNEFDPEIMDGQVIRFVEEPGAHEIIEVKALIQVGRRMYVVQTDAQVQLRPDLIVLGVSAPSEIDVDMPLDIDVDIQEMNGESAASATVSLYIDGELSAAYPGVQVDPWGVSTVVFSGITFSEPGMKELTVRISESTPFEYDVSNNDHHFAIEALQTEVFQPSTFSLSYMNMNNYVIRTWALECADFESEETINTDSYSFTGRSYGEIPSGNIDQISWSVSSEAGVFHSDTLLNWAPTRIRESRVDYNLNDPQNGLRVRVYAYPSTGLTYYKISEYTGSHVYVYSYGEDTHTNIYSDYGPYMNAQESISVSVYLRDGDLLIGGTASAQVDDPIHDTDSGTKFGSDSQCGQYEQAYEFSADYYFASASGDLGPLAKRSLLLPEQDEASVPTAVRLKGNYPNPFNPTTNISYDLPEYSRVRLSIFDIRGVELVKLQDGERAPGSYDVQWNGSDHAGNLVSTGVYFAQLQVVDPATGAAGATTQTIKMIYMQ